MKKALARLQGGIRPLVIEWRIDSETDLVYVTKNHTTVDMRTPDAVAQAANAKRRAAEKEQGKPKLFRTQSEINAPTGFRM